jgi:glycosidase
MLLLAAGCTNREAARSTATTPNLAVPAWSADAVWYQIFVERFRNGDSTNDPTVHDIEGFTDQPVPAGWTPTPWTADWYRQEPWASRTGKDFYGTIQFRRYGGDLQGVLDRLDYLQQLGVTALFLNPINDAPSLHKYDARNYHHIDRNFGPDPRGDEALLAQEDPAVPSTWQWSAADKLFLKLVAEAHRRGMRVIMDYSWNHTGTTFWAWRDVLTRQRESKYADWYAIDQFDDPATKDTNEFRYRGWAGVPSLPEWKKIGRPEGKTAGPIEGTMVPGVREHIFAVTRRWLDPDGDGNPSDGVDGFRLDVADVIPLGFWREYRKFVRSINPQAYLVGEVWWEHWPDRMYDPAPWLKGDVFDAVMHYQWYAPTRSFFDEAPPHLTASAYAAALDSEATGIGPDELRAMMNLTASHDTPRFSTSIYNPGQYKYHDTPRDDPQYRVDRPDALTRRIQEQILVQQFTWVGAPEIYYGDEVGMWGAYDPDERKPMVWGDLRNEDETADPLGRPRRRDQVRPDTAMLGMYRGLIALRKAHLELFARGETHWRVTDNQHRLLAYQRDCQGAQALVAFNGSDTAHEIGIAASGSWRQVWPAGSSVLASGGMLRVELPGRSARVWVRAGN